MGSPARGRANVSLPVWRPAAPSRLRESVRRDGGHAHVLSDWLDSPSKLPYQWGADYLRRKGRGASCASPSPPPAPGDRLISPTPTPTRSPWPPPTWPPSTPPWL